MRGAIPPLPNTPSECDAYGEQRNMYKILIGREPLGRHGSYCQDNIKINVTVPNFIVMKRFLCTKDPESYAIGSIVTGRASYARQVK